MKVNFMPAEGYIVTQPSHRNYGRFAVCKVDEVSGYSTIPAGVHIVVPPVLHDELEDGRWLISTKSIVGWFPAATALASAA